MHRLIQERLDEVDPSNTANYPSRGEITGAHYGEHYGFWRHHVRSWLTYYLRAVYPGQRVQHAVNMIFPSLSPDVRRQVLEKVGYKPNDRVTGKKKK